MANDFLNHTVESLETLLYQTKLHMAEARKREDMVQILDLHRSHAAIAKAINEIHMVMAGLR